jgi:LysM domain
MLFHRSPTAPASHQAGVDGPERKMLLRRLPTSRAAKDRGQLLESPEELVPRVPTAATSDPDTRSREFAAHPDRTFHPAGGLIERGKLLAQADPIEGESWIDDRDEATTAVRTHVVNDGDTLAKLAARYLGSSDRYGEIFAANRRVLSTPDLLPIGVELTIPPRQRPAPPAALGPEDEADSATTERATVAGAPSNAPVIPTLEVESSPAGPDLVADPPAQSGSTGVPESSDEVEADAFPTLSGPADEFDDGGLVPVPKGAVRGNE